MTPDQIVSGETASLAATQSAGITTKVLTGTVFTLASQILPMLAAFVATPFTIRFLGSEGYGVLIFVGLLPTYLAFADLGMNVASTKFGSEAFGRGDRREEGEIIRAAAFVSLVTSGVAVVPIFIFSAKIVEAFHIPDAYAAVANIALRIACVTFVLGVLATVFSTPMFARLRMDLNAVALTIPRILTLALIPIVLLYGGDVVSATWVVFVGALVTLVAVIGFSGRLLPELFQPSLEGRYFRPLVRFGTGWAIGMLATILLVNMEKLVITRVLSVRSLAFYSVAFTLANMATMFTGAMQQSLLPAFSQFSTPGRKPEFDALFARGMRLTILWLLPAIAVLFVVAKPFFTFWAGEEFGRESTAPFYLLLFGVFFNILAYIPHSTIIAKGRTDFFAKLYWVEAVAYSVVVIVAVNYFGLAGAAGAWSARVVIDAVIVAWFARSIGVDSFGFLEAYPYLAAGFSVLLPAMLFAAFYDNFSPWLFLIATVSVGLYAVVVWRTLIDEQEKAWLRSRLTGLLGTRAA